MVAPCSPPALETLASHLALGASKVPAALPAPLDLESLLAAELRYAGDAIALWHGYIQAQDRYRLAGRDDMYIAVASVDLIQQITSELLAVSFVSAIIADAAASDGWITSRERFGKHHDVAAGLRREEFEARVQALLAQHDIPSRSPAGRDMRFAVIARRIWTLAARCGCSECYQCPYCMQNDCVCTRCVLPHCVWCGVV